MIENLFSKIDTLSGRAPGITVSETNQTYLEKTASELNGMAQSHGHYMVTGVTVPHEPPTRSSRLPRPNQRYPDDIVEKLQVPQKCRSTKSGTT